MFASTIPTINAATRAIADQKKKRPPRVIPSARDQQIFKRIVIDCERQYDVAADVGITPSRVCQIVKHVRRWLAAGGPGDPDVLAHLERKRLERKLAAARHEAIVKLLMREAARQLQNPKHTTLRTEEKEGDAKKVVTTVRDRPLDVQLLKAAQRSTIELQKLAELAPIPEPPSAMPDETTLFQSLYDILCDWRRRAECEGHVMKSQDVPTLVQHLLAALLGRNRGSGLGFDRAARQLVRSLVLGSLPGATTPGVGKLLVEVGCSDSPQADSSPACSSPTGSPDEEQPPQAPDDWRGVPNPLLIGPLPDPVGPSSTKVESAATTSDATGPCSADIRRKLLCRCGF